MTGRETQEARIAEAETMWFCAADGYSPANTARWCDLGCGSDFNRMIGVPTRLIRKVVAAELEAVTARETRANEALTAARRERDEVYAVNAAAANDRARALEATIEEIVALCEPDRIPLPLLNSRILRVIRTASAAGASDE